MKYSEMNKEQLLNELRKEEKDITTIKAKDSHTI